VDPYISQYLRVTEPIELPVAADDQTRTFTPEDLTAGKKLFELNCLNCHVGGTTLPNPTVSLSLANLKRAQPPRDTITSLMAYQRDPRSADGNDNEVECRRISPAWMTDAELQNLAAFILKAAQSAPGWGRNILDSNS
jgi:photosystem II cytochrome c550